MSLQFNEPSRKPYDEFFGRNIDKMPELLADNRLPLSVAGFMKLRLRALDLYASVLENPKQFTPEYKREVAKFFKDVWSNHVDTGDAPLYHPDGKIKIDIDSEFMRTINPDIKKDLREGAVLLPSGLYAATKMPELTKEEVPKFSGKSEIADSSIDNRFWKIFARDPNEVPSKYAEDPALLRNYVKAVNHLANIAFDYDENMGVYVAKPQDVETARLVCVDWLEGRSFAGGRLGLHLVNGRLVGVAPEAPRLAPLAKERLEEIITKLKPHEREIKQLLAA